MLSNQMLITVEHQECVKERVHLRVAGVPHRAAETAEGAASVAGFWADGLRGGRELLYDGQRFR